MNIFSILNKNFPSISSSINIEEKYSTYNIQYFIKNDEYNLETDLKQELIQTIPERDFFELNISIAENDPISLTKESDFLIFKKDIDSDFSIIEDEQVKLKFEISKKIIEKKRSIYDFKKFCYFTETYNPFSFLDLISSDLNYSGKIYFEILEEADINFFSSKLFFLTNSDLYQQVEVPNLPFNQEDCHFRNPSNYSYSPHDFYLIKKPELENSLSQILHKLTTLLCLAFICNISEIRENKFYCRINGFKIIEETINLNNVSVDSEKTLIELCNWVYSEKTNISEKLGIARNIISLFGGHSLANIPDDIIPSIKSGYQTYLQSNIERYIEIRNKINEQLDNISNKSNIVIEKYIENYQKSIFSFISFFISVFILRVFNNGGFSNVFNKDATILSITLLGLSVVFLLFSFFNIQVEKKRLKIRYDNLKFRFQDLLISEDIEKILRHDKEFLSEISFFDFRKWLYSILWILTIIILFLAILSCSSYLNYSNIYEKIIKIFTSIFF